MAGIDHSIYFQQQTPDFLGNIQKGLSMREMIDNRALKQKQIEEDNALKQAYKSGVTQNPDGTTSFDNAKTFSEMVKVNPQKAMEFQSQYQQQDAAAQKAKMDKAMQQIEFFGRGVGSVKDQQSYDAFVSQSKAMGLDTSALPPAWGPDAQSKLNYYHGQALTVKDKIAQMNSDRDFGLRDKELDSRALDRKEARDERRFQSGIRMEDKMQGLKTPYGLANTEDDAKKLKEAHESKMSFDSKIQEMIDLRKKYGTEYWNREAVARGKQLSKDLLLEYKNMAKLGVLSKSDEDIINAIIPSDPLGQDYAPGQDPILSNLEKFKGDSDKDFQNRIRTRTRSGVEGAARPQNPVSSLDREAVQWARENTKDPRAAAILKANGIGG